MTVDFPNTRVKAILKQLLDVGLQAADSTRAARKAIRLKGHTLQIG